MAGTACEKLKLYVEDAGFDGRAEWDDRQVWDRFCGSLEQLTGYQLQLDEDLNQFVDRLPGVTQAAAGRQRRNRRPDRAGTAHGLGSRPVPSSAESARQLAGSFVLLWSQLQAARCELRVCEAQLATHVPVVSRRDGGKQFATRLVSILRGVAEGLGCQAAAVYLLDEATTQLKLRAHWGLPDDRLTRPARALRGAQADLEAMLGHAVVLDESRRLAGWNPPESYPLAICVPVSSATAIMGTLWLFRDRPSEFLPRETHLIEIAAGAIASELTSQALLAEAADWKARRRCWDELANWQLAHQSLVTPQLEDWDVAGAVRDGEGEVADFYLWQASDDDRLGIAVGSGEGSGAERLCATVSLQAALRSELGRRSEPGEILRHLNQTFWSASTGPLRRSAAILSVPVSGPGVIYAASGESAVIHVRRTGWEVLSGGLPALGCESDVRFPEAVRCCQPGESLILVSRGVAAVAKMIKESQRQRESGTSRFWQVASTRAMCQAVCEWLGGAAGANADDRPAVVVLRRRAPVRSP